MRTTKPILIFIAVSSLFNLINCSNKSARENKSLVQDTSKDKMTKRVNDFDKRQIYKVLTREIIDKTSDDELLEVIFDNLSEKLTKDFSKEYATVMTFNKSRRAIFVIWKLEAEVNNGGFNQFYFNSSGQYAKLTPEALKLVGADKFASLVNKAIKIYETEYKKITKFQDGTLEGFSKSYKDNPLDKLDDEFYKLYNDEKIEQLQVDYIRKNKNDFVDK